MKAETRKTANEMVVSLLNFPPQTVMARRGNTDFHAIPLDMLSDSGNQLIAKVDITILDVDGSEKNAPFVLDDAVALYESKQAEKAEKASKPKKDPNKPTEAAQKTEIRMKALRDWWISCAEEGEHYTSKMVYQALPELYAEDGRGMMLTGSDLAKLAGEGLAELEMVDKKKTYVKR